MKLDDWLSKSRSIGERLVIIERLAQAVNAVHDRGEALGGLEPAAIEVSAEGWCDLAAARRDRISPPYRAPERGAGSAATPESDIYSAGAVCYEILAGRPPTGSPKPLGELRPDTPRDLADAVMGCLERSPEWRPKDLTYVAQVAAAQQKAGGRAPAAPPHAPSLPRAPRPVGRGAARRQWPLALAALLLLAVAAAGAYVYLRPAGASAGSVATPAAPVPTAPPLPAPTAAAPATPPRAPAPWATPEPSPTPVLETPPPMPRVAAVEATPSPLPTPAAEAVMATVPTTPANPPPPPVEVPESRAEPARLSAVSPPTVRRAANVLLDVHGQGLRPEHRARISAVKGAVGGISVVRQKYVDTTLVKVLLNLEASARPGAYTVSLVDERGVATNALPLTVAR